MTGEIEMDIVEMYHERMAEIQHVSDVIAVANMQLNKILNKFEWSKQSIMEGSRLLTCPLDSNHMIRKDNMSKHVLNCNLRKHGIFSINGNNIPPSPSYGKESSVVPLLVSKMEYERIEKKKVVGTEVVSISDLSESDEYLLEQDEDINDYKPCNSLDELRFIYSWNKIPKKYAILDILKIPKTQLRSWLEDNILHTEYKEYLINSIINWLEQFPTPNQFRNHIHTLFGLDTQSFVLRLWKFLAAKCLCLNQQIPEHTRNEFDFYAISMSSQEVKDQGAIANLCQRNNTQLFLPMEWVDFNLSLDEKLSIYDGVRKACEMMRKSSIAYSDVKSQAEEQMKVIQEFDEKLKGEKSRMEVLAELRDYKRRRQSYRGKNKMTRKMSAIEILRDLFDQQMLYLNILKETEKSKEIDDLRKREQDGSFSVDKHAASKEKKGERSRYRDRSYERDKESRRNRSRSRDRHRNSRNDRHRGRSKERERRSEYKDSRNGRYRDKKEIRNITYYNDDSENL